MIVVHDGVVLGISKIAEKGTGAGAGAGSQGRRLVLLRHKAQIREYSLAAIPEE